MSTTPPNITDTQRLDFILELIRSKGTNGLGALPWHVFDEEGFDCGITHNIDDRSDVYFDREAIDAAILASTPAASASNLAAPDDAEVSPPVVGITHRSLATGAGPAGNDGPSGAAIPTPTAASETGSEVRIGFTEADKRAWRAALLAFESRPPDRLWDDAASEVIAARVRAAMEAETGELRAGLRAWEKTMESLHEQIAENWPKLKSASGAIQDKINAVFTITNAQSAALDLAQKALDEIASVGVPARTTEWYMVIARKSLTALRAVSGKGGAR